MKIYRFHPITKEYLGEGVADSSPLEPGVFIVPAFATADAPPKVPQGEAARFVQVFDEEGHEKPGRWEIVTDARGKTVWVKATGEMKVIDELGDMTTDVTDVERPPFHIWDSNAWKLDVEAWLDGEIRPKRNALLDEVDLRHCNAEKWSDMTAAKKAEWKAYKQALKDLPETIDQNNPVWPVMPS